MRFTTLTRHYLFFSFLLIGRIHAQSKPAATRQLELYTFATGTGTFTGLNGGRNIGITAGVGVQILSFRAFYPSVEIRGSYPLVNGDVDSQKSVLGGVRIAKRYHNLYPYLDLLAGLGQINYQNGGFPNPDRTFQYLKSSSPVLSPGAGIDYRLANRFLIRLDGQYQRYQAPVTVSGHLYAKPFSAGLVYTFR